MILQWRGISTWRVFEESHKFLAIEAVTRSFKYPNTLVERVQLLAREVAEKNQDLVLFQTSLSKKVVDLEEANLFLNIAQKRIRELEKYLKEFCDNQKKVDDCLRAMHQENHDLSRKLAKLLQQELLFANGVLESILKQWEYFYPNIHVYWDRVPLNQGTKDGKMVSLMNQLFFYQRACTRNM